MTVSRLIWCDRRSFSLGLLASLARPILLIGTPDCKNNNNINQIITAKNAGLISDP